MSIENISWELIHKEFLALHKEGFSKSTSGSLIITFGSNSYPGVDLEFGCYDLGDYPRHYHLGPFENEEKAKEIAIQELQKMKRSLEAEEED